MTPFNMEKHVFYEKEWVLALAFALIGAIFTFRGFIHFLDGLNPIMGFIAYYIIVYVTIFTLGKFGLVVYKFHIRKPLQVLGATLITFSFFLIFNWTSPYVQYVTYGTFQGVSNVFVNNSEDGLAWYLWTLLIPQTPANAFILWILTFIVTPFILVWIGTFLVTRHEKPSKMPNLNV